MVYIQRFELLGRTTFYLKIAALSIVMLFPIWCSTWAISAEKMECFPKSIPLSAASSILQLEDRPTCRFDGIEVSLVTGIAKIETPHSLTRQSFHLVKRFLGGDLVIEEEVAKNLFKVGRTKGEDTTFKIGIFSYYLYAPDSRSFIFIRCTDHSKNTLCVSFYTDSKTYNTPTHDEITFRFRIVHPLDRIKFYGPVYEKVISYAKSVDWQKVITCDLRAYGCELDIE